MSRAEVRELNMQDRAIGSSDYEWETGNGSSKGAIAYTMRWKNTVRKLPQPTLAAIRNLKHQWITLLSANIHSEDEVSRSGSEAGRRSRGLIARGGPAGTRSSSLHAHVRQSAIAGLDAHCKAGVTLYVQEGTTILIVVP